ncbi:MAG: hypothetical protein GX337_01260 [Christensenellaceae bacterium]|nr:hypothetical protein [Christensenellaceae bacterium]
MAFCYGIGEEGYGFAQIGFHPEHSDIFAKLFSQGNGDLYLAASLEEEGVLAPKGMYMRGYSYYDKSLDTYTPYALPDVSNIKFNINGSAMHVENAEEYTRKLNIKNGELERRFIYRNERCKLGFNYKRIVTDDNIIASLVSVEALDGGAEIDFVSGIYAAHIENNIHALNIQTISFADETIHMYANDCNDGGICISSKIRIYLNGNEIYPEIKKEESESHIAINAGIFLNEGNILTVEKVSSINFVDSLLGIDITDSIPRKENNKLNIRYAQYLSENAKTWSDYYKNKGIDVNGNPSEYYAPMLNEYYSKITMHFPHIYKSFMAENNSDVWQYIMQKYAGIYVSNDKLYIDSATLENVLYICAALYVHGLHVEIQKYPYMTNICFSDDKKLYANINGTEYDLIPGLNQYYKGKIIHLPICIKGTVIQGKKMGRKLGFPTANIQYPHDDIGLANGVYIARLLTENGAIINGIANAGKQPTLPSGHKTIEIHLFDFDGDLYGEEVEIQLIKYLREEKLFPSAEAMKEQVFSDIFTAKRYFERFS